MWYVVDIFFSLSSLMNGSIDIKQKKNAYFIFVNTWLIKNISFKKLYSLTNSNLKSQNI